MPLSHLLSQASDTQPKPGASGSRVLTCAAACRVRRQTTTHSVDQNGKGKRCAPRPPPLSAGVLRNTPDRRLDHHHADARDRIGRRPVDARVRALCSPLEEGVSSRPSRPRPSCLRVFPVPRPWSSFLWFCIPVLRRRVDANTDACHIRNCSRAALSPSPLPLDFSRPPFVMQEHQAA